MLYLWGNIGGFCLLQIIAALFFKWGGTAPRLYWWGFVLGNLFGTSSIMLLINVYKVWPANLTAAVTGGISFLCIQAAMVLVFRSSLSWPAALGVLMIAGGMMLMLLFKPV